MFVNRSMASDETAHEFPLPPSQLADLDRPVPYPSPFSGKEWASWASGPGPGVIEACGIRPIPVTRLVHLRRGGAKAAYS
jgi:hypothetical protein